MVKNKRLHEVVQNHIDKIGYSNSDSKRSSHRRRIKKMLNRSEKGRSIVKEYEDARKDKTIKGRKPTIELIYLRIKQKHEEEGTLDEMNEELNKTDYSTKPKNKNK